MCLLLILLSKIVPGVHTANSDFHYHVSFFVILPLAALHEERLVGAGKVGQEVKVQGCPQVVRVRHEHVLDPLS